MTTPWVGRAACRDQDPELFFPTAEHGPLLQEQTAEAKAVCGDCSVRAECLAWALERLPHGVAGGLTENERRRLAAARRQAGGGAA